MKLRHKALILLFLALTWRGGLRGSGGQYDPPDLFSDPFDPFTDGPDPMEIPFPPEDLPDPFDDPIPDPCLPMIPDPFNDPLFPSPPDDLPDPFEMLPDPFEDVPDVPLPPLPNVASVARLQPRVASNVPTRFMPFPMRLPFHPAYSRVSASMTVRPCTAASATTLVIAEASHSDVLFLATCPYAVIQRVTVGTKPLTAKATPGRAIRLGGQQRLVERLHRKHRQ
jgi:hypothetical protein